MAGAEVPEGCKNIGRHGGFEEGPQECVSHGRRTDYVIWGDDVGRRMYSWPANQSVSLILGQLWSASQVVKQLNNQ